MTKNRLNVAGIAPNGAEAVCLKWLNSGKVTGSDEIDVAVATAHLQNECGYLVFAVCGKRGHYRLELRGVDKVHYIRKNGKTEYRTITEARESAAQFDRIWLMTCLVAKTQDVDLAEER